VKPTERPTLDLAAGLKALEEDLPRVVNVLGVTSLSDLGWSRPKPLVLLVPMKATWQGQEDAYLLRLSFEAYRRWPPSARFVNPATQDYVHPDDQHHVPKLTSPECQTHIAYQMNAQAPKMQLICCSATFEFWDVLHDVEEHHMWRGTETFLTTINAIQKAFGSHYQGRF